MFCETCGTPIQNGDLFCMNCGAKVEVNRVPKQVNLTICKNCHETFDSTFGVCPKCGTVFSDVIENDDVLCCPDCGFEIEENEKYCIQCGTPILNGSANTKILDKESEIGLQTELLKIFNANKVLLFFLKYCLVFVLAYPIYTLMGRFEFLDSLYAFISNFSIILYFAYNIGLLSAYANKKFMGLFIALALRLLNSSILVFQSASPWQSLFRISIIVISAIFVYKALMTDSQRKTLLSRFRTSSAICSKCGCSVKSNDVFCPKCGNRM